MGRTFQAIGIMSVLATAVAGSGAMTAAAVSDKAADQAEANNDAKTIIAEKDKKTSSARKQACTEVRASIANRTANLQEAATRHIAVIDRVYENLTKFGAEQAITLSAEDSAAVQKAHDTAAALVTSLGEQEDALSCEDTNVGQQAAALQLKVQSVKDSLKEYRKAVGAALQNVRDQISLDEKAE